MNIHSVSCYREKSFSASQVAVYRVTGDIHKLFRRKEPSSLKPVGRLHCKVWTGVKVVLCIDPQLTSSLIMSTFLQDCSLLQASGPVHAARVPDDLLLRRLTHSFDGNLGRYVEQCTECLGLYRLRDRKFPVLLERELGLIFLFESGQLWQVVDGRRVFAEAIGRNRKMTERISSEATTKPSRPLVKLAWLGLPLLLYLVAWQYRLQLPRKNRRAASSPLSVVLARMLTMSS